MFIYKLKILSKYNKLVFFINLILLLVNVTLIYINIRKFIKLNLNIFKYKDHFDLYFLQKAYRDISLYLNQKFINNNHKKLEITFKTKKVIKVKSTGLFNKKFHLNWLKSKLDDDFLLNFDDKNPDYLIYNVFTNDDIDPQYKNAIRIAIYTENIMPDMNNADYIIGHYHINYLDRYFKYSVLFWENFNIINKKRKEIIMNPIRNKFCAAVISNCGPEFRMNFIDKLSKYKKVDFGGLCRNNINETIKNKSEFLSNYKFSIAMENSRANGYVSEKIVHAFAAGTIPIYYGDYTIDEFINPKTYISINGEKDIDQKIEYIKKIDNDDKLYLEIMKEKPIIDDKFIDKIDRNELKEFLKNIFSQDKYKAFRRDDNFYDFNC